MRISGVKRYAQVGVPADRSTSAGRGDDLAAGGLDRGDGFPRDERPVVTTSSTSSTRSPGSSRKPRRSSNTPCGRSTNIAGRPSARPISWPMITPPIAGETTGSICSRMSEGIFAASACASRSGRTRSISTRRILQVSRAPRPEDRMKCPSSRASAARNSPGFPRRSSAIARRIRRCANLAFNTWPEEPLEAPESRAYRAPQINGARSCAFPFQTHANRGEDEIDWMGDRPGRSRAYTCSGASPASAPAQTSAAQNAAAAPTPPAGTAQNPDRPTRRRRPQRRPRPIPRTALASRALVDHDPHPPASAFRTRAGRAFRNR